MANNIFECWAKFIGGEIKGRAVEGFILINQDTFRFKSYEGGIVQDIPLSEITEVLKQRNNLKLTTTANNIYKFRALDPGTLRSFTGEKKSDKRKTKELYSLLLSVKSIKELAEYTIIEKIKNMIDVSPQLHIDMLKEALGVESSIFYQNIFNIAAKLGLTIEGNHLNIENVSLPDFIRVLNENLALGINSEILEDEKLVCPYCGFSLKPSMKFCMQCGTVLNREENEEH